MVNAEVKGNELVIEGGIKSIDDYLEIKSALQYMVDNGIECIEMKIVDSMSITSSLIGFMLKVINVDRVEMHVYVGTKRLEELLSELDLSKVFNVRLMDE
ncbi:hypothetical protein [Limisalsivibrio acetivorans]|uniref:hypothetical protein n=1 Tax=Limisalsivibrio acetivorans TaxID=1304888 RepID=UPI0003B4122D|nr:hypothetical protein [Limisalsivibrio acetivorans]